MNARSLAVKIPRAEKWGAIDRMTEWIIGQLMVGRVNLVKPKPPTTHSVLIIHTGGCAKTAGYRRVITKPLDGWYKRNNWFLRSTIHQTCHHRHEPSGWWSPRLASINVSNDCRWCPISEPIYFDIERKKLSGLANRTRRTSNHRSWLTGVRNKLWPDTRSIRNQIGSLRNVRFQQPFVGRTFNRPQLKINLKWNKDEERRTKEPSIEPEDIRVSGRWQVTCTRKPANRGGSVFPVTI